jgi:hypothetical protein
MDFTSPHHYAGKILRLSQHMLTQCRSRNWAAVVELETERQLALDALFQHPAMPGVLPELAEILHQVILLDRETIVLGEQERLQSSTELGQLQAQRRAARAYRSQSGDD